MPRDASVTVRTEAGGRFALTGARCERRLPARYRPASSVPVELRGSGSCSRQVNNFAAAGVFETDRLIAVEDTWARGLYIDLSHFPPDSNSVRQSFHPNARGHAAFASCLTQIYNSGLREASCADPASTGKPVLEPAAWDSVFKPLKNEATGTCVDVPASVTRNNTKIVGWDCHGGRHQGWWYDAGTKTVPTELSHDRCLDVPGADYRAGATLILWNCSGAANQQFVQESGTLRPAAWVAETLTGLIATRAALRGTSDQAAPSTLRRSTPRSAIPEKPDR
ncbi:ricin-type beta-trefoil lectin domain protein [Streptomyces sp. LN499]|uniref:ricin-type beta-trefoil lectin domain protein n=1 Tax=Streptomyces sp. LN499 TaxID=3112977 RepID=UPI00371AB5DD